MPHGCVAFVLQRSGAFVLHREWWDYFFFFLFTYIDFVVLGFYFNLHYITGILKVHVILNGSEFVKRNYPQTRAVTVNIRWGWKIQETKTSAHKGLVWRPSP